MAGSIKDPRHERTYVSLRSVLGFFLLTWLLILPRSSTARAQDTGSDQSRPNILFAIPDDQSWIHAGACGTQGINTPAFDRVAEEGVLFTHAFPAAPSCPPSRSAILTGQQIWRLEEGGLLFGSLPDDPLVRSDVLDYYAEIEHVDRHLQRMLNELERRGELSNTLVLVTSDHGRPFPRAKASGLYDSSTRVPLAIAWPNQIPSGRQIKDFVSLTDIAPTVLDAAGAASPSAMTGRSLLPVLRSTKRGRSASGRNKIVLAFEKRPAEELYDMIKDPAQIETVADNQSYASIKNDLQRRLNNYLNQTDDPRVQGRNPWDRYPYYDQDSRKRAENEGPSRRPSPAHVVTWARGILSPSVRRLTGEKRPVPPRFARSTSQPRTTCVRSDSLPLAPRASGFRILCPRRDGRRVPTAVGRTFVRRLA